MWEYAFQILYLLLYFILTVVELNISIAPKFLLENYRRIKKMCVQLCISISMKIILHLLQKYSYDV